MKVRGPYTNLWGKHKIGTGTSIGAYVEIGDDVVIGKNCKIEAKVFIPPGVRIGDRVFIGPNVTFTNDKFPTAEGGFTQAITIVEDDVSIGASATILPGLIIGKFAMVGSAALVSKDVPQNTVVFGNPARVYKYPARS